MTVSLQKPKYKSAALIAASGTGKGTVLKAVRDLLPEAVIPISCTTRPIGKDEIHGVHYYYISREEFELKISNNEFLEWNIFNGNYYGTLYSEIKKILEGDVPGIFDVDINGGIKLKEYMGNDLVTIFLTADRPTRKQRLIVRGREKTEVEREERLDIGDKEIKRKDECDEEIDYGENAIIGVAANKVVNLMKIADLAA